MPFPYTFPFLFYELEEPLKGKLDRLDVLTGTLVEADKVRASLVSIPMRGGLEIVGGMGSRVRVADKLGATIS